MMTDTVLDSAVDIAREAALEAASDPGEVGDHLGSSPAGELLVTHLFGARISGYRGWVWAVTVSRAPDAKEATVCEADLIPADDALLAPPWVPWSERVQPGDLEPGMALPYVTEDPRLVPGYETTDDEDADAVALWEMGLGRVRVLGAEGREETADRWYAGSPGPSSSEAIAATASCATCGFWIALAGSLRTVFGVCANEWSPSDGRVVSLDHGCGAHSETDVERSSGRWPANAPVIDTLAATTIDLNSEDLEDAEDAEDAEPAAEATKEAEAVEGDPTEPQ
jgi:hypothetical protein